jgi:hypothetical protein
MQNLKDWIQVGELAAGIKDGNVLPKNTDLFGKTMTLYFEDGCALRISFLGDNQLSWEIIEGQEKGTKGNEPYISTSPREDIYFVDYIKHDGTTESVSLVLDLNAKMATAVLGKMPTEEETRKDPYRRAIEGEELTPVRVKFLRAGINQTMDKDETRHQQTSDLIGKRVKYTYSQTEIYEHIYLNENLYTWHCLEGLEKGLADSDRCHHINIVDDLYLFVWWEKVIPTLGVIIIDLTKMKTTGKLFGYETDDFTQISNVEVGAYVTILNSTQYD